jgi:alpha-L-fucosidase
LNVGPTAEGEIPSPCLERLAAIGRWMSVNGSAIHGTQASPIGAPTWGRITQKSDRGDTRLYLQVFDWPVDGHLEVTGLGNTAVQARLLAEPEHELAVSGGVGTIRVSVPNRQPDPDVSVVELVLKGAPIVYAAPVIDAPADIFVGSIEVRMAAPSPGLDVRFTLNGSEPTSSAAIAAGPVRITSTTTVTARTFDGDRAVAKSAVRTFRKVEPEPAIRTGALEPGLKMWTSRGDRKSVNDPPPEPDIRPGDPMPELDARDRDIIVPVIGLTGEGRTAEHVKMTFHGWMRVPTDDVYTFALTSDDGAVFHIADATVFGGVGDFGPGFVLDNDGLHSAREVRGTVALAGGWHPIQLDWFNRTGEAVLDLRRARIGQKLEPIEARDLAHQ